MKKMTPSLLTLLMLVSALLVAPTPIVAQTATALGRFQQPGFSRAESAHDSRETFSRVAWYFRKEPPTECLFRVEQSSFGTVWEELTPLQDCTSEGKNEFITPVTDKFIRINVTVYTSAIPTITTIFWEGYTGERCGKDYDGIFSTIVSSDPAAGAELSVTVPSNERWRVYSSSFRLQADGTNEDRNVFLTVSDNGNEYFRTFADGVVKADQEGIFTAAPLGFVGTTGLGPSAIHQPIDVRTIMIPVYSGAFVPGGHTLATDTDGMQPGDDYSPAVVLVERCPN